ncbi:hypothetical protein M3Y99_00838100 [Aphelenchoides fujianensis]|nr:hypothetical protein M3Y99_00838100 [Aphelenchoides fujianensis]
MKFLVVFFCLVVLLVAAENEDEQLGADGSLQMAKRIPHPSWRSNVRVSHMQYGQMPPLADQVLASPRFSSFSGPQRRFNRYALQRSPPRPSKEAAAPAVQPTASRGTDSSADPAATNVAPPAPPSPVPSSIPAPAIVSAGRGRSSSTGHHKPKRAHEPRDFSQWSLEDQEQYRKVTIQMRRWKNDQKQSSYSPPEYAEELREYAKTKESWQPIPPGESVDLPPLQE